MINSKILTYQLLVLILDSSNHFILRLDQLQLMTVILSFRFGIQLDSKDLEELPNPILKELKPLY
jgi:hypothetical protein